MQNERRLGNVLVTGGAAGLGAAIVDAVAARGGRPLVFDLDVDEGRPDAHRVDVSDTRAAESLVAEVAADAGGLDAVVTAAGIDRPGSLDQLSGDDWERVVRVNLFGTAAVVRAALPFLLRTHGRVVTVASSLALRALPDATAYCASKAAVTAFSRALAAETKGRLGVTTLFPAGMATHFFDDRPAQYRPSEDAQLLDPGEVADAVAYVLTRPIGVEVRELVMCPEQEPSWP